ncbi:MAG: S-adenosyl-l-methionine hydroxide adenosyltransferase family protein [Candidatus Bathyarchaeota archaeon]|nr:S-adenosyl-l-methionine hydroxide adenosyltransferase family protein [Candidatus Bathyarchaeota archaeon]
MGHRHIITLLTDFGSQDAYVSSMKGVILGICPEAVIVDISHHVRKFDVRQGAFLLHQAAAYFPKGTIHMAVIDPGVGTDRRRIIVEGKRCLFVGPDNGVLSLAVQREGFVKGVEIRENRFMLPNPSTTFDGRDVFAPASAHLACGVVLEEFGPVISRIVTPSFARATRIKNKLVGEVLHVDTFGNIITNIQRSLLSSFNAVEGEVFQVKVAKDCARMIFSRTYGNVQVGTPVIVVGSGDLIEISVNRGNASDLFKADTGSQIEILRRPNA